MIYIYNFLFSVAPAIDKSQEFAKAAGDQGDTIELKCKAEGSPKVDFKWKKVLLCCSCNNIDFLIKTDIKFSVHDTFLE